MVHQLQLHSAKLAVLLRTREGGVCILHPGDSHVEPTDLQFKEKGSEGCCEKGEGDEAFLLLI